MIADPNKTGRRERCDRCRYFDLRELEAGDGQSGYCRRHAPQSALLMLDEEDADGLVQWPRVFRDDWCGEFA